MADYTPKLKRIFTGAGCHFFRARKGDHEIWVSPISERKFVVDRAIKSRHLVNAVLKQAGLDKQFQSAQDQTMISGSSGE